MNTNIVPFPIPVNFLNWSIIDISLNGYKISFVSPKNSNYSLEKIYGPTKPDCLVIKSAEKPSSYLEMEIGTFKNGSDDYIRKTKEHVANPSPGYKSGFFDVSGFGCWYKIVNSNNITGNFIMVRDNMEYLYYFSINHNIFTFDVIKKYYYLVSIYSSMTVNKNNNPKKAIFNEAIAEGARQNASSREHEVYDALKASLENLPALINSAIRTYSKDKSLTALLQTIKTKADEITKLKDEIGVEIALELGKRTSTMAVNRGGINKKAGSVISSIKKSKSAMAALGEILTVMQDIYQATGGRCYHYVKNILIGCGFDISSISKDVSACSSKDKLCNLKGKHEVYGEIAIKKLEDIIKPGQAIDPRYQYLDEHYNDINTDKSKLRKLFPGFIVVWDKTKAKPHGHISITLGQGYEASDMILNQMTNYGITYSVFVPYCC